MNRNHFPPDQASIRLTERQGRIYLRWYADDSQVWHRILDDFKRTFPRHGDRSYSPVTRTWSVPAWHRYRLQEWLDCWFHVDAQSWGDADGGDAAHDEGARDGRASGRRGDGARDQGYRRPQSTVMSSVDTAYRALHLLPSAPPEVVRAAHRALIKLHHPDTGGGHTTATVINEAVEIIRRHQERTAS